MSATSPTSATPPSGGCDAPVGEIDVVQNVALPGTPEVAVPGTPGSAAPAPSGIPIPSRVPVTPPTRPKVARRSREQRGALAAVGGVVGSAALVAVAAAHTQSLLPETIRPIPRAFAGVFGGLFLNLHVGGAIAALVLMFASYAAVVSLSGQLSARVVLTAIGVVYLLVLLGPPLASTDAFSYQAYARMGATYAINPYTHAPAAIPLDPVYSYIGSKWSLFTPSAYGPVFTVATYLLAPLTVATSVFAYKGIATLAALALVAVVWRCARARDIDPVKAAALVGLNPLLVTYGVGGGHNDLLMLLAMIGGVYAVLASREGVGGGLSVLAIGMKLTGGLVLPFALADGGAAGRPRNGRLRLALGAGIGLAALAGLSFGVFGTGSFHMLDAIVRSQREGGWLGIPGFISSKLGMATAGHIAGFVLAGAFAMTLCWLLRRVWRGEMDWIAGAGWAMLAMLVASSSLLPWYVAWLLPLAALARDRRLTTTAIVFSGVILGVTLLGYIPHGFL